MGFPIKSVVNLRGGADAPTGDKLEPISTFNVVKSPPILTITPKKLTIKD